MTPSRRSVYRCLKFAAGLAATAAAITPPALAADMPLKTPPAAVVAATWTGVYVGLHGGWGWGTTHVTDSPSQPIFRELDTYTSGPFGGGQIGANLQFGHLVAGLEVDGSWTSLRNGATTSGISGIIGTTGQTIRIQALATATARLGYAAGPWLAYVKGGGAWADMELSTRSLSPREVVYQRSSFGWTAGAGLEVMFLRGVSAKAEYAFVYFPRHDLLWNNPNSVSGLDHSAHLVKVGVNIRLTGDQGIAR
jgi:outer membrane immunogenic protein